MRKGFNNLQVLGMRCWYGEGVLILMLQGAKRKVVMQSEGDFIKDLCLTLQQN